MEDEKVFIELCKKQLAYRLNWPEGKALKQRDFEYLSAEISKQTKIELSTATLRRIWSNNYKSLPQVHTLNAMAMYLGYEDWNDLKTQQDKPIIVEKTIRPQSLKWPLIATIATLSVILTAVILSKSLSSSSDQPAVSLSTSLKVTEGVPATIGFDYDISGAQIPISIELSWNPYERTVLDPADSFYTGVYYYPDYHRTKLLRGDEVLTEIPVYVTTPDWHGLVMKTDNDVHPTYIEPRDFLKEGQMGFDMTTLSPYLLNQPEVIHSVFTFSNTILEQFQADDLTLATRVKHHAHKSDPACMRVIILFKAEHGRVSIPVMQKGCYGDYGIGFSEKVISGKTNDLSALASDLDDYVDIQMQVKNHTVMLQVGDNPPYSFTYQQELGTLKVAKLIINGLGSVDSFSIRDTDSSYVEDFSGY